MYGSHNEEMALDFFIFIKGADDIFRFFFPRVVLMSTSCLTNLGLLQYQYQKHQELGLSLFEISTSWLSWPKNMRWIYIYHDICFYGCFFINKYCSLLSQIHFNFVYFLYFLYLFCLFEFILANKSQ